MKHIAINHIDHALLDHVIAVLELKNDAELAERLNVTASVICKIRRRYYQPTSLMLLLMHEASGIALKPLRLLGGDFREHTRPSAKMLTLSAAQAYLRSAGCGPDILAHLKTPHHTDRKYMQGRRHKHR